METTSTATDKEAVNRTAHYKGSRVMEIIEEFELSFCNGNVIKYLLRAGVKDPNKLIEDHEKALWYLIRQIAELKAEVNKTQVEEEEFAVRQKLQPKEVEYKKNVAVSASPDVVEWASAAALHFLSPAYDIMFGSEAKPTVAHFLQLRLLMGINYRLTQKANPFKDEVLNRWYFDVLDLFFKSEGWKWPKTGTFPAPLVQDIMLYGQLKPADYLQLIPMFELSNVETLTLLAAASDLTSYNWAKPEEKTEA